MGFFDSLVQKNTDGRLALAEQFRALLLERFPDAKMIAVGPMEHRVEIPGREPMTISLENLFRHIDGASSEDADAAVRSHFHALIGSTGPGSELVTAAQIVPMVKDQLYLDSFHNVPLVTEHFVGDLWIVYAADQPTRIATVKPQQIDELGIARDTLRSLAIENLRAILPPVEQHGEGAWFVVTAGNYYTASVLLLDAVWEKMQEFVEGDLIVAVPTRDVILVTGSTSAAGITAVRARARELEQGGSYAVSQTLLRRRGTHWVVFN